MADSALQLAVSEKGPAAYLRKHQQGLLDRQGLKEYIILRRNLGYRDNADLIEDYANTLNVKDLDNYQTVLFIMQAGPYLNGKAHKLAQVNRKIIDSIYKTEPYEKRVEMNNTIIGNSYMKAVKTKDQKLAEMAANFSMQTWGKNYREAHKAYEGRMLSYYKAVKDTSNYLRRSAMFYDQYYRLSQDSIRKHDEKRRLEAIDRAAKVKRETPMYESSSMQSAVISESSSTRVPTTTVASILNNAAYDVYLTKTNNKEFLERAIKWTRKAIELNSTAAFHDTLAHLLYRSKLYSEAESAQHQALLLAQSSGSALYVNRMKTELKKIKERKL